MTPATLARYIAHGLSAVEPFDLPALLDALRAERDKIATPERRRHISVVIAEVEHTLTPPLKTHGDRGPTRPV